jgi:hypothetical protein
MLTDRVREQISTHFKAVQKSGGYSVGDVEAGRRYVKPYIVYIHDVKRLYEAAGNPPEDHSHESGLAR